MQKLLTRNLGGLVRLSLLVLLSLSGRPLFAASANVWDVCTSGCTYNSLQAAINALPATNVNNVHTIFVDAGVLSSDVSISAAGKSYFNIVGLGAGSSIVRASSAWFSSVAGSSEVPTFLNLSNTSHVTIRGITIDALTNSPTTGALFPQPRGVDVANADAVRIDGAEILGVQWALFEGGSGESENRIDVIGSRIVGVEYGIGMTSQTWHIFSSDVRAENNSPGVQQPDAIGIFVNGSPDISVWGSHIHGESSSGSIRYLTPIFDLSTGGTRAVFLGTTLHAKLEADSAASTTYVAGLILAFPGVNHNYHFAGLDILYETGTLSSSGRVGGIVYISPIAGSSSKINLTGVTINDGGGGGGAYRADVLKAGSGAGQPAIRAVGSSLNTVQNSGTGTLASGIGAGPDAQTLNLKRGTATFPIAAIVTVTFTKPLPDAAYTVTLGPNQNETIWVTNKTATGFTLNSSLATSTATVDWTVNR